MFRALGLVATLSLFAAPFASATHYSGTRTFFVQYHFTKAAWGKEVKEVLVHTGALTKDCTSAVYWSDVSDYPMEDRGDHFNARATIKGDVDSGCGLNQGIVAQYFVTFTDGSTLVTKPAEIKYEDKGRFTEGSPEGSTAIQTEGDALLNAPDASETGATMVEVGTLG